jgi:hypothetical protein
VNPDRQITLADVVDRISEQRDGQTIDAEPDDLVVDLQAIGIADDDEEAEIGSSAAPLMDAEALRVGEWFRHLAYRAAVLGAAYPFVVSDDAETIARRGELSAEQKLYVMLLLCANLRYVTDRRHLPHWFESVSAEGMRRLMPEGAEVHLFGAGGEVVRYRGTLWQKLHQLAADVCGQLVAQERNYPPNNTGDGGLDLVGWVPFPDEQSARLILFGQCACTNEWVTKQVTSSNIWWSDRILFRAPPTNVVFIPHFFRDNSGEWHREDDIKQSILIDRLRLLKMLDQAAGAATPQVAVAFVDRALEAEE